MSDVVSHNIIGARPWMYSVKLEVSAEEFVQPSVQVYSDETIRYKIATENSGKECMK
ncbi:MAG TPA: hypothetical protein VH500_15520 [Nitrososphaeraceae archaeon]|jgi:hypothetical protein